MKSVYCLCAFFSFVFFQEAFAVHHGIQRRDTEKCNEYVDKMLRDAKDNKEYFEDPFKFVNKVVEFHKKVLFVNYTAKTEVDGFMSGMSTWHRDGDVFVTKMKNYYLVKAFFGAGQLDGKFDALVKVALLEHKLHVEAKISYISFKMEFRLDESGKVLNYVNVDVDEVKGDDIHVSGLGLIRDLMANAFLDAMRKFSKLMAHKAFETILKKFFAGKIEEYAPAPECIKS